MTCLFIIAFVIAHKYVYVLCSSFLYRVVHEIELMNIQNICVKYNQITKLLMLLNQILHFKFLMCSNRIHIQFQFQCLKQL